MAAVDALLAEVARRGGSDLHLASTVPAKARIHGHLTPLTESPLSATQVGEMASEILNEVQRRRWEHKHDCDLAYELAGVARFRVNLSQTFRGPTAVFRFIPDRIPTVEDLGVPEQVLRFTELRSGLVLVTGPTGSGKSTTLAAMLDAINRTQQRHIVTIEEPIEFVHENRKSYFTQREVGRDSPTFEKALRAATRQDPDVLLVGEMRDTETIAMAITAAEMGSLVFGTLHTNSAAKTVDRVIDVFPESQQNQIRTMLAETLRGVVAQLLLPTADGNGRVPANEILIGTIALASAIREGSVTKVQSLIEAGRGQGMQLMDEAIEQRLEAGEISAETAYLYAADKSRFEALVR